MADPPEDLDGLLVMPQRGRIDDACDDLVAAHVPTLVLLLSVLLKNESDKNAS